MTQGDGDATPTAVTLPPLGRGGSLRRSLILLLSSAVWFGALVLLGSGISPGLGEPAQHEVGLRILLLAAGLAVAGLPVLVFLLPAQRRAKRQVEVLLAGNRAHVELPPYSSWGGPERMFHRLQLTSYTVLATPLLLLGGSAVTFGFFLGEPVGALVFLGLAAVPLFFLVATWTLPTRVRDGVGEGLASGQVVQLRVVRRIDQRAPLSESFMTWFDAVLPDGQHVVLRTPVHHAWAADARGVVDADDLVLVVGKDGHQGLLLSPARPEDPVWLLGPVPLTRVPLRITQDFDAVPAATSADPATSG